MLPDETGNKKDIRQRAEEFLNYGVLGCCPDVKAALGKTVADANAPKQPEKALPGVENHDGRRFDPKAKYEDGMELHLFPSMPSREALHGQPNFGWLPKEELSEDEMYKRANEQLKREKEGPRIVQEVWEVDKQGNPAKMVSSTDDNGEEDSSDEVKGKGLGRTLREMNPGNTLIARAAKKFGVWIDDLGKFRCPPGTPQANQFTDEFGSTCFAVSPGRVVNAAQEGLASIGRAMQNRRMRNFGWSDVEPDGQQVEDATYHRTFTGARARVRAREIEIQQNIDDLLKLYKIKKTPGSNADLHELIRRLQQGNPNFKFTPLDISRLDAANPRQKQEILDAERGFLMTIAEMAITDPERLKKVDNIRWVDDGNEAMAIPSNPTGKLKDTRYTINYDPLEMAMQARTQVMEVRANQRLGIRVENAASNEEAADEMHQFVIHGRMWAGGMSASLGRNKFLSKGMHTGFHELAHTKQIDKVVEKAVEKYGSDASLADLDSGSLYRLMLDIGDDLDLAGAGLNEAALNAVAWLGGEYGREKYEQSGAVSELWKLEATAELYALREMGVLEDDDVDAALEWMDSTGGARGAEMRAARKKKDWKRLEKDAARPVVRPDGRRDHPDSPPPKKPRKARPVKTASDADRVGTKLRETTMEKLDGHERKAIDRLGDPRSHSVMSLIDPEESELAVLSIDSEYRLARKHGADLDEIDVSESEAVERVAYDPKRRRLYVTYRDRDGGPGRTYYYKDVEAGTVLGLHEAETKGRAINDIKKTHEFTGPIEKIPEKIDRTSLDHADIASQVQFNLIPALTALDKSEIGREMRVVVSVDRKKEGGETEMIPGITTARIYHDGMSMNDGEVILSLPADARGIPVVAGEFDREATGSTTLLMMPPMKVVVLDDASGRRAELVDQESSDATLARMMDAWPLGGDAKQGRVLNSSRNKVEEVVASHMAMSEGDGRLANGATTPISARRIRTRNADIHERQKRRGGSPTRPTKQYRDSLPPARGFSSMGKVETAQERKFGRISGQAETIASLRGDAFIDPEIKRLLSDRDDRQVADIIESVAVDFHEGIDRRPRVRVSSDELDGLIRDGGRVYKDNGHASEIDRQYQALIGIHSNTDDIDRPVAGYVVHPAQDSAARKSLRRSGKQVGDAPIEWPVGSNPNGDVDADGDIEIVLKPEVSGRTAYGFGYGVENKTRPVWMNSNDASDIADAIVHVDSQGDPEGSKKRILNALSARIDGDYGSITDMASVKPASTSQNEKTEDFAKRTAEHFKASKPQRLGAQIMGGFVNEEISEIRYPWSRVSGSAADVDISDVVNKEPISDRLRRLGFSNEEIEYFYKMNGDRSVDYISSATMASLREYRKAIELKKNLEARGMPNVVFSHPSGLDPLDVSSYSPDAGLGMDVEKALQKAINEEVDALLEKMLKQVRKTRGKIWEMNPKVGVRT